MLRDELSDYVLLGRRRFRLGSDSRLFVAAKTNQPGEPTEIGPREECGPAWPFSYVGVSCNDQSQLVWGPIWLSLNHTGCVTDLTVEKWPLVSIVRVERFVFFSSIVRLMCLDSTRVWQVHSMLWNLSESPCARPLLRSWRVFSMDIQSLDTTVNGDSSPLEVGRIVFLLLELMVEGINIDNGVDRFA